MLKTEIKNKYDSIIESLTKLNYSQEDINEIVRLEREYDAERKAIEEECEAEGYPSNGSNYELRGEGLREWYNEQQEYIHAKYETEEESEN